MEGAALDTLSLDEFILVARLLDPGSLSALERASRRGWLLSASPALEPHWAAQCDRVFGVQSVAEAAQLAGAPAGTVHTSRQAYGLLWRWAGRYSGGHSGELSLIRRAVMAFRDLRDNLPLRGVVGTLNLAWEGKGATEAQLDDLEKSLTMDYRERSIVDLRLPDALRAMYRVCNGQSIDLIPTELADDLGYGCFGGYAVYDTFVTNRLLSCDQIEVARHRMHDTMMAHAPPHITDSLRFLVPVVSSLHAQRPFAVNCQTGDIFLCSASYPMAATPPSEDGVDGRPRLQDGTLRWLEEFVHRLKTQYFGPDPCMGATVPLPHFHILPRTKASRQYSEMITKALRITFAAALTDVHTDRAGRRRFVWSYSLQFSLLSEEDQEALPVADRLKTVQLKSRHWRIVSDEGQIEEVNGEAVVGEYPILRRPNRDGTGDTEPFVYQSRTISFDEGGSHVPSMYGHFRFVPGTLDAPEGDFFNAICGQIYFDKDPGFVY
mmetsp:Transcript_17866/g.46655  ORF Transcript_17866/g.46655 Transcript_17866/m.46655 type:complete len:492 (-) Transcript_17866:44-1519(-)